MVKSKFASKVSANVMEDILRNPDSDTLDGAEREITVFFSDVRGFTNISEAMGDAKSLIKFMNEIMEPMTEEAYQNLQKAISLLKYKILMLNKETIETL